MRPRRRTAAALLAALSFAAAIGTIVLTGCSRDHRPALVLVILDTTRADRLGCYGDADAATATLDSLAASGVRCARTITAAPVTGPSIATILSGALPDVHGMRDNARFVLSDALPLLSDAFADAGYRTGAVVAGVPISGEFGYARGFASYDDRFAEDPYPQYNPAFAYKHDELQKSERRASAVTDHALAWIRDVGRGDPFLLMVHYYDAHGPYDPPPPWSGRLKDPYDGEVAYASSELGRLLAGVRDAVGDAREVRVVAVGDHGEGLGDHDEWTHGFFVYDTTLEVPLIFAGGGLPRGGVVAAPVRTVDIAPTIRAWFGLPAAEFTQGRDLSAALAGGTVPAACDTAVVETFMTQFQHDWSPLQGIRTPGWKWIHAPRSELYDLAHDPGETHDLDAARPGRADTLSAELARRLADAAGPARRYGASLREIDPELQQQLASLGYVAGKEEHGVVADWSLPDPKDGNREWNAREEQSRLVRAARAAHDAGRDDEALDLLGRADKLAALSSHDAALYGVLLHGAGRDREACATLQAALASETEPAGRGFLRLHLAEALAATGRRDAALAQIDTLLSDPRSPAEFRKQVEALAARIRAGH